MNRTILNLKLNHQALRHGIAARQVSFLRGGIEDQSPGAKIDGDVAQLEKVHADDGIGLAGELGIARQITDKHGHVAGTNGTELNFREGGRFPLEISVKVETLRRVRIQLQFFGNSLAHHADGRASVQDELQVGLVSDAAFDLDKVPGRQAGKAVRCQARSQMAWVGRLPAKAEGKKRLRQARENSQRFMEFASAAAAARTSFRLPARSLNSPRSLRPIKFVCA